MELEDLLLYSQELVTEPYPVHTLPPYFFKIHFNFILPSAHWALKTTSKNGKQITTKKYWQWFNEAHSCAIWLTGVSLETDTC
jgi:hypothetical protein